MRNVLFFFMAFGISCLFTACDKEEEGGVYESYRYELWKTMLDNNWSIDYIGLQYDNGAYSDYLGQSFDRNHEGIGGIETQGVLDNLPQVLDQVGQVDVVLLGVGGNDMSDGNQEASVPLKNLSIIIRQIQQKNPSAQIFLEKIAPAHSSEMNTTLTARLQEFYDGVDTLASNRTTTSSSIIVVDMSANWSDSYYPEGDPVHYNESGAREVAQRYYNAMQGHLTNTSNLKILPLGDSRVEGARPE